MVRASLKNPFAVAAISLIVVILGVVSYRNMVVDIFPEINLPVVAVATFYKGMGPSEVEGAITLRLEQAFLQASYIEHIESRSLPGVSLIKIYFQPSYDVNAAVAEITSLTYSNLRYLPQGIFPPVIIKFGAASLPIAVQTTSSETMSEKDVRDIAYFNVRPQFGSVPGIMYPTTFGGTVRQITVFLDPERMLARGVSTHDIVNSVNAQSVLLPAGDVKIGDFDYNVYTNSMIKIVDQMIPLKLVNGVPVFLHDVGKAVDSTMIQTNVVRINGHRAVYLPIMKQAGANTLKVIDGIKEALPKLVGIPKEIVVKLLFDQSLYIRQSIHTLEHEGLLGGGLACLMVLLFLGSLRYTLIIALAIPLSVTAAFIGLYFTGHTINIMTLGGLALAVGRLVDDAIVVVENTHRHMEMGKTAKQAAGDAVTEVAMPMLVITITVFLVFLPIAFFTGIIKFLFVPLALTVAYAMMASYFVALTVAPVTIAWLFRKGHGAHGDATPPQHGLVAWWNRLNLFDPFVERYVSVLRWCLDHKALVVIVVALTFGGSVLMAPRMATEFFPKVDAGSFILNVSAPEGTRIEKTEAIIAKTEELIRKEIPEAELDQIVSNVGLPQGWMVLYSPVNGPHQAFILVTLVRDHTTRTQDIVTRLRETLYRELPGLKFSFQTGGIVSDVINFGLPAPIDIKVSGINTAEINDVANRIRDVAARVPGTADVQVRQGMDYPEIHLDINRAKASYVGLNEQQIVTDLITGLASNVSLNPGYWIDPRTNNAYFVVTQFPEQLLVEFEDFLNMPLIGTPVEQPATASIGGAGLKGTSLILGQTPFPQQPRLPGAGTDGARTPVLLRDLVDVVRKVGPETVDHYNLLRTMDVLVSVNGNDLGHVAAQIRGELAKLNLPQDVRVAFMGEFESMRGALAGFAGTLPLAMVFIYLVMVGLFRSWLDPLVIMFAVPLGFIGVIWMLLLTDTSVNVESLIGTLMMIGIVVSNSVLLVDFTNNRLREGMPLENAVIEAGRLRIRPILMTSLATVLGLAPMALGIGEGSEANMPLARAVIGGLTVSTFMTLLFIPVLHAIARRRSASGLAQTAEEVH
jgi:multidrug efflux pump subunit AcrB